MVFLAAAVVLLVVAYVSYRLWSGVSLLLACLGFLVLAPIIFGGCTALMNAPTQRADTGDYYLAFTFWFPPVVSLIWVAIAAARTRNFSREIVCEFLRNHILLTQPTIAIFCGSATAAFMSLEVERTMRNDEIVMMSLFALIVFLVTAWFVPYALRPMLRLEGRSEKTAGMLANLIGLLLALMVSMVAFKAREKFGDMSSALNALVDGVVAFLIAALAGAGALLAAAKVKARSKEGV